MELFCRDYREHDDLALLRELISECWRIEGPLVYMTPGDATWQMFQHLDKLQEVRIRLWLATGDTPLAFGWLWLPETLMLITHPERREELVAAVLDWFETEAQAEELSVRVLDADARTVAAVEARGYLPHAEERMSHLVRSLAEPIPEPELPSGFVVRTVGRNDLEERVAVHRAAFEPSRVVAESYRRVMAEPPYRAVLDHIAVAPDGRIASFCLCWLDEANRLGELEPVGTHPDFERRGLARAACFAGLRSLASHGATTAVVYAHEGSGAQRLYEGIGFRVLATHVDYRREAGRDVGR